MCSLLFPEVKSIIISSRLEWFSSMKLRIKHSHSKSMLTQQHSVSSNTLKSLRNLHDISFESAYRFYFRPSVLVKFLGALFISNETKFTFSINSNLNRNLRAQLNICSISLLFQENSWLYRINLILAQNATNWMAWSFSSYETNKIKGNTGLKWNE